MGIDGLVREAPIRRQRISFVLALALATAVGVLAGTRVPPPTVVIDYGPPPMQDTHAPRHVGHLLGPEGACFTQDTSAALRAFDPGHDRIGLAIRTACATVAAGPVGMLVALRAMDPATRKDVIHFIVGWSDSPGEVADRIYDIDPDLGPYLHAAALYNLRRGNDARSLAQFRGLVAALAKRDRRIADGLREDGLPFAILAIEALERRAERNTEER